MQGIRHEPDPFVLFGEWFEAGKQRKDISEPTAMTLATVDAEGRPDARIVLLKGFDDRGFVFYTNTRSQKGAQVSANAHAALVFHWMPMERQTRVRGSVSPVSPEEADAYFASRPKQSQIGAWASKQSQPLGQRLELEKRVAQYTAQYGLTTVPRPEHWSGYRIVPDLIEFWMGMPFRLHDRLRYRRTESGGWETERLFP